MTEKCEDRIQEQWKHRQKDLRNNEFEPLGFDYVEPGTWPEQLEGYYRWQFSWGGPSDELRAFVNLDKSIHRLEYWFLDWGDGAKIDIPKGPEFEYNHAWTQMQTMIRTTKVIDGQIVKKTAGCIF